VQAKTYRGKIFAVNIANRVEIFHYCCAWMKIVKFISVGPRIFWTKNKVSMQRGCRKCILWVNMPRRFMSIWNYTKKIPDDLQKNNANIFFLGIYIYIVNWKYTSLVVYFIYLYLKNKVRNIKFVYFLLYVLLVVQFCMYVQMYLFYKYSSYFLMLIICKPFGSIVKVTGELKLS